MSTILLVIILILIFGGGGGYYAHGRYGAPGLGGVLGIVLIVLIVHCGSWAGRSRCAPRRQSRPWVLTKLGRAGARVARIPFEDPLLESS